MNLLCNATSREGGLMPASIRPSMKKLRQAPPLAEAPSQIECVQESLEESIMRFRSNSSYGLNGVLTEAEPTYRNEDGAVICELKLTYGKAFVCVSNSRQKLRRLLRKLARKGRAVAQGFVAQVGGDAALLRTRLANCIRTACHVFRQRPDFEAERQRQKVREKRGRWTARKNFQPQFA